MTYKTLVSEKMLAATYKSETNRVDDLTHFNMRQRLFNYDTTSTHWDAQRIVYGAAQMYMVDLGLHDGIIDGRPGPTTEDSVEKWQNWYREQMPRYGDPKKKTKSQGFPHDYSKIANYFGDPEDDKYLTRMQLPYPMKLAWDTDTQVNSTLVHRKVEDSLHSILSETLSHYGKDQIEELGLDLFGGVLNKRRMRGGIKWSTHSWGIAIDIDPARNRLRWDNTRAELAKPNYDVFRQLFRSHGWTSLGEELNYDWMHFQACGV